MIFVTVGHQMPFDRLVSAVDRWAFKEKRTDVFAQIGNSSLQPRTIDFEKFLTPEEFQQRIAKADYVVAHAGMGTIITALEHGTPILVMPRLERLQETRNDHQVATAKKFRESGQITVAMNENALVDGLNLLTNLKGNNCISSYASAELLNALKMFFFQTRK